MSPSTQRDSQGRPAEQGRPLRIGLDFDNTLVCYDQLFHDLAVEAGLLGAEQARAVPATKTAVRDHLRERGLNDRWTELQGLAYGPRIVEAQPFESLISTLRHWQAQGHTLCIVSHKTERPYAGPAYDLHAAARAWLSRHLQSQGLLQTDEIFFESERQSKLERIAALQLDAYVDDLPDILQDLAQLPGAPPQRWLFDPHGSAPEDACYRRFQSWAALHTQPSQVTVTADSPTESQEENQKENQHSTQGDAVQQPPEPSLFGPLLTLPPGTPPRPRPEDLPPAEQVWALLKASGWSTGEDGDPADFQLELLSGGWNNRVYKLSSAGGSTGPEQALLKHYYRAAQDQRPRLQHEYTFLSYTSALALPTPRPLGHLADENMALYSWVDGQRYSQVGLSELLHALNFLQDLNGWRTAPQAEQRLNIWQVVADFPHASEACHSLNDHLEHLNRRMQALSQIDASDPLFAELRQWLSREVEPVWLEILEKIQRVFESRPELWRPLQAVEHCLSPSDFGFHNAIKTPAGPIFIDFEYAGWDDPAQLLGSFFAQFEVPAPAEAFDDCAQQLAHWYSEPAWQLARMQLLRPIQRLRWLCIALNHFLPAAVERRRFAAQQAGWAAPTQEKHEIRQLQEQARKARRQLQQLQEELPQWHTLTF